jgi:uncharacterized protein (TIGR02145 family)
VVFTLKKIPDHIPDLIKIINSVHNYLITLNIKHEKNDGEQVWMAENLAYLPRVFGPKKGSLTELRYYIYEYYSTVPEAATATATANYTTYGVIYNWPAALTACPEGWHLPSDDEWTTLTSYLGGADIVGGKMKEAGTTHWEDPNTGATNESGFTALPGGYRYRDGTFCSIGLYGYWWSSAQYNTNNAWCRALYYHQSVVGRGDNGKAYGFSVRCVQD